MSPQRLVCALLLSRLLVAPAAAQPLDPIDGRFVAFEVLKPNADDEFTTGLSSAWKFTAGLPLEGGGTLELEVPFAYAALDRAEFEDDGSFAIGNPALRIRSHSSGGGLHTDLTVRPPVADADEPVAVLQGLRAAAVDEPERFVVDYVTATIGSGGSLTLAREGLALFGRIEGSLWIDTGERDDRTEVFLRPTLGFAFHGESVTARLAARADHQLTASGDVDFADATVQEAFVEVELRAGRFRPGLMASMSLDEDLDVLARTVLGLRLTVGLD